MDGWMDGWMERESERWVKFQSMLNGLTDG